MYGKSDTLRVMFYNVENLFDLSYRGTEYDSYSPEKSNWNDYLFKTKVENLASAIAAVRADIVGLCEIESPEALEALRRELRDHKLRYRYSALADSTGRTSVTTALLSTVPLGSQISYPVQSPENTRTRHIFRCDILIASDTLTAFVNHWPSKYHPESHRLAAAKALDYAVDQLPPDREYLILGDLNVNYDECVSLPRSRSLNDTKGLVSLNHLLKTVQSAPGETVDYVTREDLTPATKQYHFDCWLDLSRKARQSSAYRGRSQTPDHILLPWSLVDSSGWTYVDSSFRAFTWSGLLMWNEKPYRWQMKYHPSVKRHTGKGYSDHLPIYAEFVRMRDRE